MKVHGGGRQEGCGNCFAIYCPEKSSPREKHSCLNASTGIVAKPYLDNPRRHLWDFGFWVVSPILHIFRQQLCRESFYSGKVSWLYVYQKSLRGRESKDSLSSRDGHRFHTLCALDCTGCIGKCPASNSRVFSLVNPRRGVRGGQSFSSNAGRGQT